MFEPLLHTYSVYIYLKHIIDVHDVIKKIFKRQKERMITRHNRKIKSIVHTIKDLVMLH